MLKIDENYSKNISSKDNKQERSTLTLSYLHFFEINKNY